ncbi:MAG: hypothetical protein AB8A47_07660, partial [Prochlorococcus sp.]
APSVPVWFRRSSNDHDGDDFGPFVPSHPLNSILQPAGTFSVHRNSKEPRKSIPQPHKGDFA